MKPLCDFLNVSAGRQESSQDRVCSPEVPCSGSYRVRFLVALVPDPLDSHLAYLFDRAVDAIQHGVQDSGYILDRFSFSWKKEVRTQWHLSSGSPDAWLTLSPKAAPRELHRRMPGMLLFRGAKKPQELVAVLLVGETPISGIQREALTDSLRAIAGCRKQFPGLECEGGKTRILGPYFSGSAESLRNALLAWKARAPGAGFEILSGSATVNSNLERLSFGADSFGATVIPDNELTKQFFRFLKRRLGIQPAWQVALFVEAGTGYGSDAGTRYGSSVSSPVQPKSSLVKPKNGDLKTPALDDLSVRFVIQFPLHISQLRGAYAKDPSLKSGGLDSGPRHGLELPLDAADGDPPDIVPSQDSQMASNMADLALAAAIETIRREPVRLVGIVASDPRDVLFLARKIGEAGANVSLFTSGADILYAHPDYQRFLRGMLIVTPYPLFLPNQRWMKRAPGRTDELRDQGLAKEVRRIAFPGVSEEGIYNAIAFLLSESPEQQVIEYHAPDGTGENRPPVWITAVGRGAFWPVEFRSDYDDKGSDYDDKGYVRRAPGSFWAWEPSVHRPGPPGFILSFLVVDLLVAFFVVLYLQGRRLITVGALRRADELFSVWGFPEARSVNRTYVMTLFLVAFLMVTTMLAWFLKSAKYQPDNLMAWAALVLAVVLFPCISWIVARELVDFGENQWKRSVGWGHRIKAAHALAPAALVAALAALLGYYLLQVFEMTAGEALTFSARALDLTSTLGPVVPFLLTTGLLSLWAASGLQRAYLLAVQGNHASPFPNCPSLGGIEPLCRDVVNCVASPVTRLTALLVPLVVLIPFYKTATQQYTTIDGGAWSLLFRWLLLGCYFVVFHSFTLLVLMWVRLRRVLQRLAHHPIAEAFRRLPESCTATPWKLWRTVPNLTTLSASVVQLRVLVNLGKGNLKFELWSRLDARAKAAEKRLEETFVQDASSLTGVIRSQLRVRAVLRRAVMDVTETLEEAWAKWPRSRERLEKLATPGRDVRDQETSSWLRVATPTSFSIWDRGAEEFLALRVSAFLRLIFQHMKNLLSLVFLGFLLMLAAIDSYPFQPKHSAMALLWCLVVGAACLTTWVFIGMERDPILSNIGKTEPGKVTLNRELLGSLAIYVVLPVLTLLASEFPAVGDVIFSVFNPAMKSLSH